MSLSKVAATIPQSNIGPKCSVSLLKAKLDKEDLEWLADAFLSECSHSYIGDVLRGDGHKIADDTLSRHRRRKCSCESL